MRKKNTEMLGEVLKQYFEENPPLRRKLAESRILSAWSVLFGKTVASYTSNIYLKNNKLYVCLTSSVLRSELLMAKERMIKALNEYAGMDIIEEIVLH